MARPLNFEKSNLRRRMASQRTEQFPRDNLPDRADKFLKKFGKNPRPWDSLPPVSDTPIEKQRSKKTPSRKKRRKAKHVKP